MKLYTKYTFISYFMIFMSLLGIFCILLTMSLENVLLIEIELFFYNSITFSFIFYFDWVSVMFITVVLTISALILIYSKAYMVNECYRFMWLTIFFIFFMVMMVLSPSLLGVILGWDGLGLISFCLVIYYQGGGSFNSGFITAATNRLGDSFLILSIVWTSMSSMFLFWEDVSGLIFFMGACMTKSAQFPFSAWLPAAMAAPTPISSLVHSSTLVTAGVYMLIRFYDCLLCVNLLNWLLFISIVTIFVAGVSALQEFDMKRLVAFSTLGQLGFMMMILSVGGVYVSFFHLLIHALFKALLFMCTGLIIYSSMGGQDLRKMGGLMVNPVACVCLNISMFSLMGLPFSSGFFSKDLLLELVACSYGGVGFGIFMMVMALITVTYSVRVIFYLNCMGGWVIWSKSSYMLTIPIFCLTVLNVVAGGVIHWMMMDLHFICLGEFLKSVPLIFLILGLIWHGKISFSLKSSWVLASLLYISGVSKLLGGVSKVFICMMKTMDQGWGESLLGVNKKMFLETSLWVSNVVSGDYFLFSLGVSIVYFCML
uniref:NADH-ubiquinone oxidoreductase chain 5 n=1 Tax=Acizzia uncatoides TaxID=121830 RepID=A0A344A214_ACIUN|nr:NADH dehydrogenase subunit 5 [Acizzia uncatoides]AWU48805.1 NADH dehydrogenase subunit 5 [Acizzia uncatoides]